MLLKQCCQWLTVRSGGIWFLSAQKLTTTCTPRRRRQDCRSRRSNAGKYSTSAACASACILSLPASPPWSHEMLTDTLSANRRAITNQLLFLDAQDIRKGGALATNGLKVHKQGCVCKALQQFWLTTWSQHQPQRSESSVGDGADVNGSLDRLD